MRNNHRYIVALTPEEREFLNNVVCHGEIERQRKAARVLLMVDANQPKQDQLLDADIAQELGVAPITILRIKRRAIEHGISWALDCTSGKSLQSVGLAQQALQMYEAALPVKDICTTLNITRQTFYKWLRSAATHRHAEKEDPFTGSVQLRRLQKRRDYIQKLENDGKN